MYHIGNAYYLCDIMQNLQTRMYVFTKPTHLHYMVQDVPHKCGTLFLWYSSTFVFFDRLSTTAESNGIRPIQVKRPDDKAEIGLATMG